MKINSKYGEKCGATKNKNSFQEIWAEKNVSQLLEEEHGGERMKQRGFKC